MERIASFSVNHTDLYPGLYVSRRDRKENLVVTTFAMRFTAPNREPVMDMPAIHTIEHLGATFLRNSDKKVSFPFEDENGDIEYLGKKYSVKEICFE